MAREKNEITIDGHSYLFHQFGAKQSLKNLTKLMKIIGEPLAAALTSFKPVPGKKMLDGELNIEAMAKAVGILMSKMDDPDVLDLIEDLCGNDHVLVDGKKIVFDTYYSQNLGLMLKVLRAALEVQYGNFFAELFESLPIQKAATTQDLPT